MNGFEVRREDADWWLVKLKQVGMVPKDARLPVRIEISDEEIVVEFNTDMVVSNEP